MRKIILLIPFILAIFAVSNTVVEKSFSSKKITLNTKFFKNLDSVKMAKKPIAKVVEVLSNDFGDVKNLKFNNPKVITKKKVVKSLNTISFNRKTIRKVIEKYKLNNRSIKLTEKKIIKKEVNNQIIELDITEKVNVYAYTKVKEIKKTDWSAIFEYSPAKIKKEITLPKLAKTKTYYENKETPIRISNIKKVKEEKIKAINKTDRISTKLSANEKSTVVKESVPKISGKKRELKVVTLKKEKKGELVFFDYSAAGKDLDTQKVAKTKVLKPKSKVIVQSTKVKKATPPLDFNNIGGLNKSNGPIGSIINEIPKIVKHDSEVVKLAKSTLSTQKNAKAFVLSKKNYNSEYSVQPYNVNGTKINKDVLSFEIRFDDDIDEIVQSYGEGEINLKTKINTEMSIRRGTIYSASYYPTTVDFVFESNEIVAKIPLLQKDYMNKLVLDNKVTGFGSQLLVELDNRTEDVDIDAPYERKVFLNKKLQQIERGDDDYSFILFIGAETGNTIISFKTIKNKTVSKIIHLEDSELYYEPNFYVEVKTDDFEITEEYLLSKENGPLSLDPKDIRGLTFEKNFKKLTSNRYRVEDVLYPLGMRSYIELKHLNESVYLGRWGNKLATLPSEQYMRHVLNKFKINSVGANCLVQINLPKAASELYFNGQSKSGAMRMQAKILDKDGIFYTDLSNESEKIFLLGEEQGIINVKVKYTDGSFDYLQSYCSDNTYLVEQL